MMAEPLGFIERLLRSWGFHHMPAFFASAQVLASVEMLEVGKEVRFDVFQFEDGLVQLVVARFTEPHQTVVESFSSSNAFDDQTH